MLEVSLITVGVVLTLAALAYRYITRNDFYFADKAIPFMKPTFALGNLGPLMLKKRNILEHFKILYDSFPDAKVFGFFNLTEPLYMVRDPEMAKKIAVKDFDHFVDHTGMTGASEAVENSHMLVTNTLVALRGNKWRDMRATLSPAFTGSKMRQMFTLIAECGQSMVQFYQDKTRSEGPQVVETKELFSRFANDVIATAAFGLKVDSFKEQDNEFYTLGKSVSQPTGVVAALKMLGYTLAPRLMVKMNVDFLSREQDRFFRGVVRDTMKTRQEQNIYRPDMIELLMQAKKGSLKHQTTSEDQPAVEGFATVEESQVGLRNHDRVWTDDELAAQAFIFFFAGFETVSITLSLFSYELTKNADIQAKLYQEILATEQQLNGQPLNYETLQSMKYLDMVTSEVLRVWPIGTLVDRCCIKDYVYDDGQGCRFTIEKGKTVFVSIVGLHNDPQYFPNPDKFDPERFSDENRHNIKPNTYLPFGIGPRNCIGSRFALMELKTIIYYLLLNFSFEVHEKTQIPLRMEKSPNRLTPEKGIWLELRPRSGRTKN
ncbi:cytochrome P450 9b2 [Culex quinquefasciatus]|uniref:Cytochrome P450 9b2 n=1 Tax=Culex quinquefasciatus TaxID=7176 RepID=B0WTP4_CULQU|nr:cytochrome P450 9b2 [Culex quinquefasciatus]|eukprot:XP_001855204.1 cytochrome P450 9b2 [Culex quinquefasciatus]